MPNGPGAAAPVQAPAPAPPAPVAHPDPAQSGSFAVADANPIVDFNMDFANPLTTGDVLNNFDFDAFLNEGNDNDDNTFDFSTDFSMEAPGEISTQ